MAKANQRQAPVQQLPVQQTGMTTADKVGLVAGAGGAIASSAGGTTVTTCPPDDTSFYCKFVKGFNIFKMLLFIVAVLIGIWFVWYLFKAK